MNKTCPPCRQSMDKYDDSIYVEYNTFRVYVCCSGCANKMQQYWNGYITIMKNTFNESPEILSENINPLRIINQNNKGVCGPCSTGLCMLKEHLPPEAQTTWSATVGNIYGKIFHKPNL